MPSHQMIVMATCLVVATAAPAQIDVRFNYSAVGETYVDPYRGFEREGHDLESDLLQLIHRATASIDVAVYELRLPMVAKALAAKAAAGVRVRVIVDNDNRAPFNATRAECEAMDSFYGRPKCLDILAFTDLNGNGRIEADESDERDAMSILAKGGVPVIDDTFDLSRGSGLMHHKFVIVDDRVVLVSSGNFTWSCLHGDYSAATSRGNANGMATISSREVAGIFRDEFDAMWGSGVPSAESRFGLKKRHRGTQVAVVDGVRIEIRFSPTSSTLPYAESTNGWIAAHLRRAAREITAANFVFSEQALADAMSETKAKWPMMSVRAVGDRSFATRYYSEILDLWGLAMRRLPEEAPRHPCTYENDNKPWSVRAQAGVVRMASGDKMHHKFAVIDSELVLFGSHNWSEAANRTNDEAVLAIYDRSIAATVLGEFERLMRSATIGPSDELLREIAEREQRCAALASHD